MSFPALALACEAAASLEPLDDDEFGLSWADITQAPDLYVDWVIYESMGAGVILRARSVHQQTVDEWMGDS